MIIACEAVIDNIVEREKFCDKIRGYGIEPLVVNNMVYVDFEGDKPEIDKFIQLFENYYRHGISIISP